MGERNIMTRLTIAAELTSEADLGLTHEDGKYLIRHVQSEIAHDRIRVCCCGRLRAMKCTS